MQARIVTEEAADAPYPVVMVPLEVTHTALATTEVLTRIRAMGSPFADMVRGGLLLLLCGVCG
jgi:inosine-uridine nucleoside N-ribohydrolase